MGKSTNFSGHPIFTQLLNFLDKSKISKAFKALSADKYVKRFTSYKQVVVMLFAAFEGYNSIRETLLGLLSNARRLQHLGLTMWSGAALFLRLMPVVRNRSLRRPITIRTSVTPEV